jgi:undecaprenyl-diphosphatase
MDFIGITVRANGRAAVTALVIWRESSMSYVDHWLRAWIVAHRVAVLNPLMWSISAVGRGGLVWLMVGSVLVATRRMRPLNFVQLALSILLASTVSNHLLKPAFNRERPYVSSPNVEIIGARPDDASFPSGHAANAFAGMTVLLQAVPAGRLLWWPLALTIAYSRVYLGVHYPLDVIGGAVVGWLSAVAIRRAIR